MFAGHYHVILWNGSREFYNMFSFVTDKRGIKEIQLGGRDIGGGRQKRDRNSRRMEKELNERG